MASSTGAERITDGFWEGQMDIVNSRQAVWYREHVNRQGNEDYSAGGRLPGETERVVGSRMFLAGELVDQFLQKVGIAIMEKLCRSKSTGEMQATSQFVLPRVMSSIEAICVGCGVHDVLRLKGKRKKDHPKRIRLFIDSEEVARKIFEPARFDGSNYLAKRSFRKNSSGKLEYSGVARVVVTQQTPILFEYVSARRRLTVTCSVQRYNADGTCIDSTLQEKINSA